MAFFFAAARWRRAGRKRSRQGIWLKARTPASALKDDQAKGGDMTWPKLLIGIHCIRDPEEAKKEAAIIKTERTFEEAL